MKTLVLRVYLTLVAVLALFALAGGWLVQQQFEREREAVQRQVQERLATWADFAQSALPEPQAPPAEQAEALDELARRFRLPLALEDAHGRRVAASDGFLRREAQLQAHHEREGREAPAAASAWAVARLALPDGRSLLIWRTRPWRGPPDRRPVDPLDGSPGFETPALGRAPADLPPGEGAPPPWRAPLRPASWSFGPAGGIAILLGLLFVAVAAAAWPVSRRLTRRLETLQRGVEAFGDGRLHQRVAVEGRDEISSLARSFNQAAERIEALVAAHRSLLANASHEIRSPLARLKMAASMLEDTVGGEGPPLGPERREQLRREVHANIAELDALVDEVLLASRLDALPELERREPVALARLIDDEASRLREAADGTGFVLEVRIAAGAEDARVRGDERLLRRAVRNLLENARRYGGGQVRVDVALDAAHAIETAVSDRGVGVPPEHRERIFEPFFRLPGHAEQQGGVGLGLSLVRQIARRHGGTVRCEGREGGGSRFVLTLPPDGAPAAGPPPAGATSPPVVARRSP